MNIHIDTSNTYNPLFYWHSSILENWVHTLNSIPLAGLAGAAVKSQVHYANYIDRMKWFHLKQIIAWKRVVRLSLDFIPCPSIRALCISPGSIEFAFVIKTWVKEEIDVRWLGVGEGRGNGISLEKTQQSVSSFWTNSNKRRKRLSWHSSNASNQRWWKT